MLHDLDNTLAKLLHERLAPNLVSQVAVSFASPDGEFPPPSVSLPAIDLFLYDLRENTDLRSSAWSVEIGNGRAVKRRPPVRLDCSYLVTAWVDDSSPTPALDEHRLLGEVMKVLLRHPTVPADLLQGSLAGQQPPLPAITLQPGRLQSLGEFWQAMGGKPKAAFSYTVTIGVEVDEAVDAGPLVTERILKLEQIEGSGEP